MAMPTAVSTQLREEAIDLCRGVERDAARGNAYAAGLVSAAKALARNATTVDEGMRVIQSMTVNPYSRAAQEKIALLYDRAALRNDGVAVTLTTT